MFTQNCNYYFSVNFRFGIIFCFIIFCFIFSGCNSFGERHIKLRDEFTGGQIDKAKANVNRAIKNNSDKDIDLLKLNSAMIELCCGNFKSAELLLREVRDKFDRLENEQVLNAARNAKSFLTDDNAIAYSGEDYEKVLIRVFLAISNLMQDGSDAYAYSLQINDKQNKIIERKKSEFRNLCNDNSDLLKRVNASYCNVAIGAYLSGILLEESKRNYYEAYRNYERANLWANGKTNDGYKFNDDLERAKNGVHSKSGNGVVYIFVLAGKGPYKVQRNCEVLQDVQVLTTALLSHFSEISTIPDFMPVMIPVLVTSSAIGGIGGGLSNKRQNNTVKVLVDGNFAGETKVITDVSEMALGQFEANKPMIIAKTIIRRAFKKGVVYGAKKAVDANSWVGLALELGGMVWEGMETADTRCWNLLPDTIQMQRIELPAGEHEIILKTPMQNYAENKKFHAKKIKIKNGKNTYVLANFIDNKLIGNITTNNGEL
ncbi:MAG: hypothetical protein LBP59_11595 [Planctomycetaceae bacterium]|jgi:hypothetical protein|nr:hypothetical protein [Planctomycetaceae bacterium]